MTVTASSLPGTFACGNGFGIAVVDPSNNADFGADGCTIVIQNPLDGTPLAGSITNGTFATGPHTSFSGTFSAPER